MIPSITLSIVIPVYNEEAGFAKFFNEMLITEVKALGVTYEILLVNDGSKDGTLRILQDIAENHSYIRVINLSRNFGKEVALTAGIREAIGDAVITLDSDGQQPPALISQFIEKWKNGAEVVTGIRSKFEEHGLIPRIGSKLFYKALGFLGVKETIPGTTDFRLMDRVVVDEFNKLPEHGRITRSLVDWMGFERDYVHYVYGNRLAGKPSYNFKKLVGLAIDSFVGLSTTPLIAIGWLGGIITFLSTFIGLFVIVQQFILGDPLGLNWTGPTCLAIFITFLVGLVMIAQGVISLYISHIHNEAQGRPLYIIDRRNSRNLTDRTPVQFKDVI